MSSTLDKIEKACGLNVVKGQAGYIYIQCLSDVATIPNAVDYEVNTPVGFNAPADGFHKWATSGILSKNTYKCEQLGDEDGKSYRTTVVVFVPGLDKSKTKIMAGTAGCGHLIVTEDLAGNNRLVGTLQQGANVSFVEDNNGDTNGYTVTITADSATPPPFYTATIAAQTAA